MSARVIQSFVLGDLVVAAFDEAARFSGDPTEVSELASAAVIHLVERAAQTDDHTTPSR